MPARFRPRSIEPTLSRAIAQRPVVLLTGPRQSGKTTLLRRLFGTSHRYVSLDDPVQLALALRDPELFLDTHPAPVIFDEIQQAPSLLPSIKLRVDAARSVAGRYLLTGSQQIGLMAGVTESLAGRVAVLTLLPMSLGEQLGVPAAMPFASHTAEHALSTLAVAGRWLRGGWPELVANRRLDMTGWYASYVRTYLERDVRAVRAIGDLRDFQAFLLAAASRHGQLVNLSDLSRDLGVVVNTIKAWLSVLEATHQIVLLRPYHRNISKRLVKSPKLYFLETGLVCHLLGLETATQALRSPTAGALIEGAVLGELVRSHLNRGRPPRISFFRTADGDEVDFLVEHGGRIHPIEVKLSATPSDRLAAPLDRLRETLGSNIAPGQVVCLARDETPLTRTVRAVPFARFALGAS